MGDFKDLHVWQLAHALTLDVYQATTTFPAEERYGLTSQLRRAACSVPSNIAEGTGRGGDLELARFLRIARGSASEVEYQLLLARDLRYLNSDRWSTLDTRVARVSGGLRRLVKSITQP